MPSPIGSTTLRTVWTSGSAAIDFSRASMSARPLREVKTVADAGRHLDQHRQRHQLALGEMLAQRLEALARLGARPAAR